VEIIYERSISKWNKRQQKPYDILSSSRCLSSNLMARLAKPEKKKDKEPGGLIKKDRTADLIRKLNKDNPRLWKSDWNK